MKQRWKYAGIFLTVLLTVCFTLSYIGLESFYYDDPGCGYSSGCTGFYMSRTSKATGWVLLVLSISVFIASIWRVKNRSILWTIPALTVFITVLYGNGYMLFNKGGCGLSINQTTFFIFQNKLGDFAKADGESLNPDRLKTKTYHGKLLGYYLEGNNLTVYRIADKPLHLKTGFLFWQPDKDKMMNELSYGLSTFREPPNKLPEKKIELMGGQEMPLEAFMAELKLTNNWGFTKILDKKLIHSNDGTTTLILSVE